MTKPPIYGDQIMTFLVEVEKEMDALDTFFVLDEHLSLFEKDAQHYAMIRLVIISIYEQLKNDEIRGINALTHLDELVFSPHRDLVYRLIESNHYPALRKLHHLMEDYYY